MSEVEILMWVVVVASLVGTILNIQKNRVCFHIWFWCNISWTIYDVHKGAYPQAVLMATYAVLAVYGWYTWVKDEKVKKQTKKKRANVKKQG